ncbi:MAG TPA: DUF1302 family protein [Anaeromyxobacteraceae bacterium]|jgi:hypothetical protein
MSRPVVAAALAAAALALWMPADALDVDTGAPDLALRFDNTFRYNLGLRTDPVDARVGSHPAFTAGEHSVAQGSLTASRLDLLSELDLSHRDRWGGRLSAAAWYDDAYRSGTVSGSPALAAAGIPRSYVGNELSDYSLRRYRGPWIELLDAFVFARFQVREVPVTVKAGRHALCWGESLMQAGAVHGVSYSQMPLDLQKGFATPGVEAKELFRPLAGISVQAQVAPGLSLAGQVFLEWQSYVYPEGGTFLGAADFAFNGPSGVFRNLGGTPAFLANAGASRPREAGDWGVALRWGPEWLDGTLGLYVRRYTDKLAAVLLSDNPGAVGPLSPAMGSPFRYRQYYAEGVDLVGLSLAKQVLGVSAGAEVSVRHDTPLLAQSLGFVVAPAPPLEAVLFPHGLPRLLGNTYQARGDTLHLVANAVGVIAAAPAFGTASWAVELTYSRWLAVRDNPDMFFGEGYGVCRTDPDLSAAGLARNKGDGCATRDHVGVGAGFTPTWFQVFPGVDVLAPLAAAWTIRGNSPVALGGNEGAGTYSAGIGLDVRSQVRFDLKYVDFFGRTRDDGTAITSANGLLALLKSRGSVTLTAKATF